MDERDLLEIDIDVNLQSKFQMQCINIEINFTQS